MIPDMESPDASTPLAPADLDARIAARLKALRAERGWTLADLADRSGVSRATLSRIETAQTSATAQALGRICDAAGVSVSRLVQEAEAAPRALVPAAAQEVWTDPETGFRRRLVSPPGPGLSGEVIAGEIPPATRIAYPGPARPGMEHHLVMRDGALSVAVAGAAHALRPGDCLRYALDGPNLFETPPESGASYLLFLI